MTVEDNKALVREYYETVVSTGNVSTLLRYIAPEYLEVYQGETYALGVEGAAEHIVGVRRTYPDLQLEVEQQIAEGDWVVTRLVMTGTHEGEWLGIKPTGRRVRIETVNIDRLEDGRIVEHGGAANLLEPLLEIGAVKIAEPVEQS